MKMLKEKIYPIGSSLLPNVSTFLDKIRVLFFALPIVLLAASCGDNATQNAENKIDEMSDKVEARVDTIQQNMKENRDEDFVKDAAEDNQEELQLLNLVGNKAWNKELKSMASKMKKDHAQLGKELGEYAAAHNIAIEVDTMDGNHDLADNKSGADWDKKALDELIDKHETAVKNFEKATEKTNETNLKSWAVKSLPVLQEHLNSLLLLKGKMK